PPTAGAGRGGGFGRRSGMLCRHPVGGVAQAVVLTGAVVQFQVGPAFPGRWFGFLTVYGVAEQLSEFAGVLSDTVEHPVLGVPLVEGKVLVGPFLDACGLVRGLVCALVRGFLGGPGAAVAAAQIGQALVLTRI